MTNRVAVRDRMTDSKSSRQFVDREEYILHIMSRRQLERCDDSGSDVRGLFDPATGRRIFIEANRLLSER